MAICWYLLEANIYLSVAYLFYVLLLKKYTFFQQHRYYLLFASFFCFIIPLISWRGDTGKPAIAEMEVVAPLLSANPSISLLTDQATSSLPSFDTGNLLLLLFFIVAAFGITRLVHGVIQIALLHRRSEKVMQDDITIALLPHQRTVFSFFNWIFSHNSFINDRLIREHEMIHARELHSADILWFELVKAINWFNPVSHLLLRSVKINHEFIVDAKLTEKNDPYAYAMALITHAHDHSSKLTHAAFASGQIEMRMTRMTAEKSPRSSRRVLLLLLPVLLPLICFSIFKLDKSYALLTILTADGSSSVPYQKKINADTVYQNIVANDPPGNSSGDTIPRKQVSYSQMIRRPALKSRETITGNDTILQKKNELSSASLFPSSEENRRETAARPHDIENRSVTTGKESVYGKYAALVSADTAADHEKGLRRVVSVYPENRYADPAGSTRRSANSVSLFDSTKYKSAFQ